MAAALRSRLLPLALAGGGLQQATGAASAAALRSARRAAATQAAPAAVGVLVRAVPDTFASDALRPDPSTHIDLARARAEHDAYVAALRRNPAVATVHALPKDNAFPDSNFVEDAAVVFQDTAVLTVSGAVSRRGEAAAVGQALCEVFGLRTVDMAAAAAVTGLPGPPAREQALLDGGDVLLVGQRHFFVGLSRRTTPAGAAVLRRAFAPLGATVTAVPMPADAGGLHLKSVVTWAGPELGFVLCDTPGSAKVLAGMREAARQETPAALAEIAWERCLRLPPADAAAANVLRVGNVLYYHSNCRAAAAALEAHVRAQAAGLDLVGLDQTEHNKADAALTCSSIIVPLPGP